MEKKIFKMDSFASNYEVVNPEFAKVKISVCYEGENRNGSIIPRNVLDEMAKTIYGVPVVAEYDSENNCFKGHGGKLEITDDGVDFIQTTVPYGFVDPTTPVFYETITELDGITKHDYLSCYAYLWYKRYPEVESVLKNQDNKKIGQSMEVEVEDYSITESGLFEFKKAHFSALALLGVEPCFESAQATSKFSIDDSKVIYQQMIDTFKSYTIKNFEEGGEIVEENKEIETVEGEFAKKKRKCSKCEQEIEFEDEFDENEEFVCEECSKENYSKKTTVFELSFDDIREKLYALIKSEDYYCWIVETFADKFIYFKEIFNDDTYECKYYKQGYAMTNEEVSLVGDAVEVFAEFLTQEEINKLSEERTNYEKAIEEANDLKVKYVDLEGNYSILNEEVIGLREFKSNIEKAEYQAKVDEELSKYSELNEIEGYADIIKDKYTVDLDKLITDIKVFAFDNGVTLGKKSNKKNFSKETTVKIPVSNFGSEECELTEAEKRYGIGIRKYLNK